MSTYGVDNLATLPELNENILVQELKVRYQQNVVYVSYFKQLLSVADNRHYVCLLLLIANVTCLHTLSSQLTILCLRARCM